MTLSLDELIRIQDALDAMDDTSALTRADFVEVNHPEVRYLYAKAWDEARGLIRILGGIAQAAKYIQERIQEKT